MLTFKVRDQERQGWLGLALIPGGMMFCLPAFFIGGMLSEGLSLGGVALCLAAGFLILFIYGALMGIQSCDTGLPSAVISAEGMGVLGARFVAALLLGVTSVGWFGVQAAACGASFSVMMAGILGISLPAWACTIFWGLVMTFTAMLGFRALSFLSYIMVPVLILTLVYTLYMVISSKDGGLAALLAYRPVSPMPLGAGISVAVGAWAMGACTTGDWCRYAKNRRGLILSLFLGVPVKGTVVFFAGALFRIAAGNADMTALLAYAGLPSMALITLILSAWTTNMMNAYSGSLAVSVLLGIGERRFKRTAVITGLTGTLLGAAGILSLLSGFLSLLSSLVPPIAGVVIGAWLARILRRRRAPKTGAAGFGISIGTGGFTLRPGFHLPGLIAYGLGALTAWRTGGALPFLIPPVNGIIVAIAVYMVLEKLFRRNREKSHE
ncbi:MAG: cytosine permease [Spirochaetales bacterium]|jgi:cytosine permease|nr:cytosine permease [Spirochaetales bacterium]